MGDHVLLPQQVVTVAVRFDDIGSAGHINNAAAVRIIDEARKVFLGEPAVAGLPRGTGMLAAVGETVGYLVRQQTIEYTAELQFSLEPLTVHLWVTRIGRTSFALASTVSAAGAETPAVHSEATLVLLDRDSGRPWPLTEQARAIFGQYLGVPRSSVNGSRPSEDRTPTR